MDIGRTDGVGGAGRIEGPQKPHRIAPPSASSAPSPTDKVEISQAAHLVSEALSLPQVRTERIDAIKQLIESGKFETDERLRGAIEKFLDENSDIA